MPRKTKKPIGPLRSLQVPATAGMLYEMEERLAHKMDSGYHSLKVEINGLKSDFHGMKSDNSSMKADISSIKSELHRVALLVEEQNARNKYVMDGYAQIYELLAHKT